MCGKRALVTLSPSNPSCESLQPNAFRFQIMDLLGEVKNEVKRRLSQIEVTMSILYVSKLVRSVDT